MIGGVGGGRHTSGLGHGVVSHWFVPILEQEEEEGAGHLSSGMEWHRASVAAAPALLQGWWMEGWPCLSLCHMGACPSSSWDSSGEVGSTVWACVACAASAARCSLLCQHLGPQLHPRVLGRGGVWNMAPCYSVPASHSSLARDFHKLHLPLFSL